MTTTKTILGIKTRFITCHYYPEAPEEVSFLRNPHRHEFNVTAELTVGLGSSRELEFFMVQQVLTDFLSRWSPRTTVALSCEQMATCIGEFLLREYPSVPHCSVTVQEDTENYAIVVLSSDTAQEVEGC